MYRVVFNVLLATCAWYCLPLAYARPLVHKAKPDLAGYLPVGKSSNNSMYYAFYECDSEDAAGTVPIILWLQGGPGCASTFGAFYELGPYLVNDDMTVEPNPGSWTLLGGLLLLDQPVGTGYSLAPDPETIPRDEMTMASQLYHALQAFFTGNPSMQSRPLFITGESYAGKYVPSIAHYILQVTADAAAATPRHLHPAIKLTQRRVLHESPAAPLFSLAGIAIGNGLTDPITQTRSLAPAAFSFGLLTEGLRDEVESRALEVVGLISAGAWQDAHLKREALLKFLCNVSGVATLLDVRRIEDYDGAHMVDRYFNLPRVKAAMGADTAVNYSSCSAVVADFMANDTMQSVKKLIPDLLAHLPVLLYQGQYDVQDGVASSNAWITSLDWPLKEEFNACNGSLWAVDLAALPRAALHPSSNRRAAGWRRKAGMLTQTVVYGAGHMVPHDQPLAALSMLHSWMAGAVQLWGRQQELAPAAGRAGGWLRVAAAGDTGMTNLEASTV